MAAEALAQETVSRKEPFISEGIGITMDETQAGSTHDMTIGKLSSIISLGSNVGGRKRYLPSLKDGAREENCCVEQAEAFSQKRV